MPPEFTSELLFTRDIVIYLFKYIDPQFSYLMIAMLTCFYNILYKKQEVVRNKAYLSQLCCLYLAGASIGYFTHDRSEAIPNARGPNPLSRGQYSRLMWRRGRGKSVHPV